jgi:hypothetical protein
VEIGLAIQIQGNGGVVAENDGETFDAMRVTVRPVDYGALGQYRLNMWANPVMAAGLAGGSDIWQARWTSTPQIAIIWGLDLDGFFASTAFAAGFANFSLTFARSWTADGSGGTAANLTGNNNKLRTSMGSSLMGAIRNATGSSTLTTGTRTLDAQALGILPCSVTTTTNTNYLTGPLGFYGATSHEDGGNPAPLVLSQNEGLVVRATVPGTGTWGFAITMAWSEVTAY